MINQVIDDPIFNRLNDEPTRRRAFDTDGMTDVIVEQRRRSSPSSAEVAHLLTLVG
jgi:hypothetical protein